MALEKSIEVPNGGGTATYHRIMEIAPRYVPDPYVPGSIGTVAVMIGGFLSQEARLAGAGPLNTYSLLFRFGADVVDQVNDVPVAVIATDEPTREDVYEALQQSPIFEGAVST